MRRIKKVDQHTRSAPSKWRPESLCMDISTHLVGNLVEQDKMVLLKVFIVVISADVRRSAWGTCQWSVESSRNGSTTLTTGQRFDQWVERACFLYHVSQASSTSEAGVCCSSSPLPALANVLWTPDAVLQFSLEPLSCDPAFAYDRLQPFNCQPATLRVINTLLHGGVGGRMVH